MHYIVYSQINLGNVNWVLYVDDIFVLKVWDLWQSKLATKEEFSLV